jgi:hypothetical protein
MTEKLPYHIVSPRADALIMDMMRVKTVEEAGEYYRRYVEWLRRCGYTPEEYQRAELEHIESGWVASKIHN